MSNTRKLKASWPEGASHTPIDREKLLSLGYLSKGQTRDKVVEYRDPVDGHGIKATTDQAGNTVTEHNTKDDRVDVMLRPKTVYTRPSKIGV